MPHTFKARTFIVMHLSRWSTTFAFEHPGKNDMIQSKKRKMLLNVRIMLAIVYGNTAILKFFYLLALLKLK